MGSLQLNSHVRQKHLASGKADGTWQSMKHSGQKKQQQHDDIS